QQTRTLAAAVTKLNIPVYLGGMARGLLGKENPLQKRHHRREAIKDSHLIILARIANDFRLDYGRPIGRRPFLSINRSSEDLTKNKKPTIGVHADPQEFLIALSERFQANCPSWIETLRARDGNREENISQQANMEAGRGINPVKLFRELDSELDD